MALHVGIPTLGNLDKIEKIRHGGTLFYTKIKNLKNVSTTVNPVFVAAVVYLSICTYKTS